MLAVNPIAQSIPTQYSLLYFSQSFITPFHPQSAMLSNRVVELRWQVTGRLPIMASYVLISHHWDGLTLMELSQCLTAAVNDTKRRKWLIDCEGKEGLGHRAWWKGKGIMGIIRIPWRGGEGAKSSQKDWLCTRTWWGGWDRGKNDHSLWS